MNRLNLIQGDDQSIPITVLNKETGDPENITGWKLYFTIKRAWQDTDPDAIMAIDVVDHIDPVQGLSAIPITAADASVPPGVYQYDLQAKDNLGNIITIVVDEIVSILPEITRRTD